MKILVKRSLSLTIILILILSNTAYAGTNYDDVGENKIFPTFIITILIVSIVLNIIFLLSKRTNVQFIKSRIKTRKRR